MKEKRIFTFWEPKDKIPSYLKLCMKTWSKFLPEYKIEILDYSTLDDWLGENYFDDYLKNNFSLPIQADAIRAALLKNYGGIWLDTDSIITSGENFEKILSVNSEFVQFNTHIAFIHAQKNSKIATKWDRYIKKKIAVHKKGKNIYNYIFHHKYWRKFKDWSFLGQSITEKIIKNKDKSLYISLTGDKYNYYPCLSYANEHNISGKLTSIYRNFYFQMNEADYALKNNCGIILLNNSWTPAEIKKMTEEEFLKTENTCSNLLKKVLES